MKEQKKKLLLMQDEEIMSEVLTTVYGDHIEDKQMRSGCCIFIGEEEKEIDIITKTKDYENMV